PPCSPRRPSGARRIDRAAPRAGLASTLLDEFLETMQIAAHAAGRRTDRVPDVFDDALRLVLHLEHDAGTAGIELVERHDPGVPRAPGAGPCAAGIGDLLGAPRPPRLLLARDLRPPDEMTIIELADFAHALHEVRELLELRPLVVRGRHGHVHVDRLFD